MDMLYKVISVSYAGSERRTKRGLIVKRPGPLDYTGDRRLGLLWLVVLLGAILHSVARADAPPPTTNPSADDARRNIILPTEPGDHKLKFRTHIGDKAVTLPYLLHLPPDYNDPNKKHPMLVFFHGVGECGTDLAGVYSLGPMSLIKEDGGNPTFAASCPFILLCPQCPPHGETWDTDFIYQAAAQLVDQTIRKTRCDPDRVYATGLSMGGLGTWCVSEQLPDAFAAAAPLSAMRWHPQAAGELLKYVSVWCVVGLQDEPRFVDGTREMDAALRNSPMPRRFDYYLDNGHDAWSYPYHNPQFYEWLLSRRRPGPAMKKKLDTELRPPTSQPMPTAPGHYLQEFQVKIGDQPLHMDYVLYLPRGYSATGPKLPAMLFLHEESTIGPDFKDICMHGPDLALERKPALQNNFPFVVISPRLPIKCDWQTDGMTPALLALLNHVSQGINIDPARISLSGINAGASGAWKLASEAPSHFTAVLPVITDGVFATPGDSDTVLNKLAGRVCLKTGDSSSINQVTQLIAHTNKDWKLMKLPNSASALGDLQVYNDHPLLLWLAGQKK